MQGKRKGTGTHSHRSNQVKRAYVTCTYTHPSLFTKSLPQKPATQRKDATHQKVILCYSCNKLCPSTHHCHRLSLCCIVKGGCSDGNRTDSPRSCKRHRSVLLDTRRKMQTFIFPA
ncbi:hypothetical protein TNCV_151891 [Trichonephila clavipes]|uniref:Uncharacterized protein n=1 Tax=Trichonephila clavipes TaxID=2585209 RepID=A0A8X6RE83_TRICX|nr:hypothetical protein TNCV_151891 [Trichonephila clavipes]